MPWKCFDVAVIQKLVLCEQLEIGAHVDGTPWSFVVSLNCPVNEFSGGGRHTN